MIVPPSRSAAIILAVAAIVIAALLLLSGPIMRGAPGEHVIGSNSTRDHQHVIEHAAVKHDISAPLATLTAALITTEPTDCANTETGCGTSPPPVATLQTTPPAAPYIAPPVHPRAAAVEQTAHGYREPAKMLENFDGHGFGLIGPHGQGRGNNPSDNSLAVGPNHIYETVNSLTAVYTKKGELFDTTGMVLFGPIGHNVVWNGFGGECERSPNGDTVVRYDQLADRWLVVMPRFNRAPVPPGSPEGTQGAYGMCYALSTGPNPLGTYYRYYFERELFPDYPRPAIWTDGYYVPTSTGDDVIEKHACVIDRAKMLVGGAAKEQCIIIRDVNFLNNADIDGKALPPAGAPNIMIATGGSQLNGVFSDSAVYAWKFHVDWENSAATRIEGPERIAVAPYNYLCNGQLTRCVPQPGTDNRLDAQGDKIMQRVVYRNIDGRESIVAVHSINSSAGAGGVRWYEFRLNQNRDLALHQQGTYAPDSNYRWMASPGMDRQGNIGIGYSFGGVTHFPGQRFAARLADDTLGKLTLHETVLVNGGASQTTTLRWQDYTTLAMDPSDDCTFWYQGDYWKAGAPGYTVRIGAFRVPGCMRGTIGGSAFYDANANGMRDPNEPGLPGWRIGYAGAGAVAGAAVAGAAVAAAAQPREMARSGTLMTDRAGDFKEWLPADPAYFEPVYYVSAQTPANPAWTGVPGGTGYWSGGTIPMTDGVYTVRLRDRDDVGRLDFGFVCSAMNSGGAILQFWTNDNGRALLAANDPSPAADAGRGARGARGGARGGRGGPPGWRPLINATRFVVNSDGTRFSVQTELPFATAYEQLQSWLRSSGANPTHQLSIQLAVASLNMALGAQSGTVLLQDPVANDRVTLAALLARVSSFISDNPSTVQPSAARTSAETYLRVLEGLNSNAIVVTPNSPAGCPMPF